MFRQVKRPLVWFGALGLLALACGCGKGRATVNGKVTFNNQPVGAGTVSFWAGPSSVGSTNLKPDGSYSLADAPVGDVKITVTTPANIELQHAVQAPPPGMSMPTNMIPKDAGESANPSKLKAVRIPDKYKEQSSTPLTYTVTPGVQQHDIVLTP